MKHIGHFSFFAILFFTCLPSGAEATRKIISVKSNHGHWSTDVTIHFPKRTIDNGVLVILVPGSESIGEPEISNVLTNDTANVNELSNLGKAILRSGFTYVHFNTRGVYPIANCLRKQTQENRLKQTVETCWNNRIRGSLNWTNIEDDIEMIIKEVKDQRELRDHKIVILARSEGGLHISRLLRAKRISPFAVINLSVPTVSPLENARLQLTSALYLQQIKQYLIREKKERFWPEQFDQLFIDVLPIHRRVALDIISRNGISVEQIETYIHDSQENFNNKIREELKYSNILRPQVVGGYLLTQPVKVMGSGGWYIDSISDNIDYDESTRDYRGRKVFIFGANDFQVGYDKLSACGEKGVSENCKFHTIEGVGHSLLYKNGIMHQDAIRQVIESLNNLDK